MNTVSLNQFLVLFTWFPLAMLLMFLLLIARFYQKFSGESTYYRLFLVPVILYGAAGARYASISRMTGDIVGDLLLAVSGFTLIGLCLYLYRQMTTGRG